MKKTLRFTALTLLAVMAIVLLASCSGPSGKYGNDNLTMNFSGSKVTITYKGLLGTYDLTGKVEMGKTDDGKETITITLNEVEKDSQLAQTAYNTIAALFSGTKFYNSGKDSNGSYIEINAVKYYKK